MSIFSDFEDRIGRGVEGVFADVFRSPVQPAELARAVSKEMDRRRVVGIGKVYAPTLYSVLLSPEDDQKLGGFADTLAGELETYLVSYAREHSLSLAARPVVRFLVDEELKLGRFDVIGELLSPDELAEELGEDLPAAPSAPPVVRAGLLFDAESDDADDLGAPAAGIATVTVRDVDHDVVLRGPRMVIGRINGSDICINDANTSFTVKYKDGRTGYFGYGSNTALAAANNSVFFPQSRTGGLLATALAWGLGRVEDRFGNRITYSYTTPSANSSAHPDR